MGYASIAIGLGLGGGKSATSNGRSNVAKETFTTATLSTTDSYALSVNDTYTLTVRPSAVIGAGDSISIVGLTGSTTSDNGSLTVAGTNAAVFGSSGAWTQSSGTLVLTVAGGQSIPTGSDTVITFVLANPSSVTGGVSSVTLTSSGFSASDLTGTFLKGVATYNVTTRDTEANILASTPSNPSGEVTNAFGTDTYDLYVWDGSAWYIYKDFNNFALSLDGSDDYMVTSFAPSSIGTSDYSISLWFNITAGATEDHPYFFAFGANASSVTNTYQGLGLTGRSGNGYKVRINNYYTTAYSQSVSSSTSDVTAGNWYHFVLVRSGNTLTLYKDGSSFLTLSNSDVGLNDLSLGSEFRLGYGYGAATRYINGLVDELSFFNSALSASDVSSIYNSGVPSDLSSLNPLGWWRMGDNNGGVGTTITDQGSGGNNGTLTNGPTFSTNVP